MRPWFREAANSRSWNKVISVNLTGVFLCSQVVGRQMVRQGYGNIINISSTYGLVGADQRIYGDSGINSSPAYAASKAGVANLTRYLAAYWEGKNIRVNTLSPGGVFNNQNEEFVKKAKDYIDTYLVKKHPNIDAQIDYFSTSAKDGTNVDQAFSALGERIIERLYQ